MTNSCNPTPKTFSPDDRKMEELIVLLAEKSEADPNFGATKLNKLLFFIDFLAYAKLGKPVTGHQYFKLDWGPAPRKLLPIRTDMERRGRCAIQKTEHHGYPQTRLIALSSADASVFSGEEVVLIDRIVKQLWKRTGRNVSDLSHLLPAWKAFAMKEDIPYEAVFVQTRNPTDEEAAYARELMKHHA